MSAEQFVSSPQPEEDQVMADAPSPRARALRDEIFGSALTLDETAYILGLDRTTVAKYLRERSIGGFQIGREWLVPEEELRAYVRRMTDQQLHQSAEEERAQLDPKQKGLNIVQRVRREFLADQKRSGKDERPHMAARFDKFTKRARTVLALAQEEAVGLNHNYIGTEHLLLGLIREGEGVAARVLALQGIELQQARSAVERVIGRGEHPTKGEHPAKGEVGLTPRAKKVMELAVDEARHLNHRYIGTEHLLLGLVREGHGIAASVLESLGATLQRTRAETLSILSTHGPRGDDTAGQESAPPIPTEAAALLREDEQALICSACAARNPHYFRYCFNCGQRLEDE